jgi:glycosyltransferase involved in cell wall biosynthesis
MIIKFYPYQPHCFAFGGFDLQMLNTLDAIKSFSVNANKLDVWSRDNNFNIIHLWGISFHNYKIIDWSNKAGKKIVATVLLPDFDTLRQKISYLVNYYTFWKLQIKYFNKVDKFVVVNDLQLSILVKYYKVNKDKIYIIPNIVEDQYFKKPSFNFANKYNTSDYILCVGNICKRKNQFNLAKACINLNINLVLIGNLIEGDEFYEKKLLTLIKDNNKVIWIRELPKASEELVSAYKDCKAFALISHEETQPISALEATVIGKPIILANKAYAKQEYFKNAFLVNPNSIEDIIDAISAVYKNPNKYVVDKSKINDFKSDIIGLKYKFLYTDLIFNSTTS